jgi:hypothetical protein
MCERQIMSCARQWFNLGVLALAALFASATLRSRGGGRS